MNYVAIYYGCLLVKRIPFCVRQLILQWCPLSQMQLMPPSLRQTHPKDIPIVVCTTVLAKAVYCGLNLKPIICYLF